MVELSIVQLLSLCIFVELLDFFHQSLRILNVIKFDGSRTRGWFQFVKVNVAYFLLNCLSWNSAGVCHQKLSDLLNISLWKTFSHAILLCRFKGITTVIEWNSFWNSRLIIDIKNVVILSCIKIGITMIIFLTSSSAWLLIWVLSDYITDLDPLPTLPHVSLRVKTVSKNSDFTLFFTVYGFWNIRYNILIWLICGSFLISYSPIPDFFEAAWRTYLLNFSISYFGAFLSDSWVNILRYPSEHPAMISFVS